MNPENSYGFENGPNGLTRRCLYKKDYLDYLFDYTYDFWNKYSESKKLMLVEMNDGHDCFLIVYLILLLSFWRSTPVLG